LEPGNAFYGIFEQNNIGGQYWASNRLTIVTLMVTMKKDNLTINSVVYHEKPINSLIVRN
jgi:hypothetical protein